LLRSWKFFELEGLNAAAEQSRQQLAAFLSDIEALAATFEAKRDRALAVAQ
jgi:acyl-[acyl-carrier-protein] desaturase